MKRSLVKTPGRALILMLLAALAAGCSGEGADNGGGRKNSRSGEGQASKGGQKMSLALKCAAFESGSRIPVKYTADGEDLSPPLSFEGVPEGTVTLALICDDPDAPVGTWDHWVLFNIPPGTRGLAEGVEESPGLPEGSIKGKNGWGKKGWRGPSPPPGRAHRYFFRLYALDTKLDLEPGAARNAVLDAMKGHILDQAEIYGTYGR